MSEEIQPSVENVVNPKSLERQIKLLEQRMRDLQTEIGTLEKRREACHVLLGIPLAPLGALTEGALAAPPAKKTIRHKKKDSETDEMPSEEEQDVFRPADLSAEAPH